MMTFGELLHEKKEAIAARWCDGALATYSELSSALFKRQKDPFANPIGHSLRVGAPAILEALLDDADKEGANKEKIKQHLHEIIRIRAVQDFPPSQAVGFVFLLKEAVRAELAGAVDGPRFASELAKLDEKIDRMALDAFDLFVACREKVYDLRVNELKRNVSWIMDRMNIPGFSLDPESPCAQGSGPLGGEVCPGKSQDTPVQPK